MATSIHPTAVLTPGAELGLDVEVGPYTVVGGQVRIGDPLDPETLEPRPRGGVGLLAFMDLANVGSVSAVLTEDLGHLDSRGGLRLLGRAPGAEPRGCSLALEGILEAQS